jgi:hypothetical protein
MLEAALKHRTSKREPKSAQQPHMRATAGRDNFVIKERISVFKSLDLWQYVSQQVDRKEENQRPIAELRKLPPVRWY